MPAPAAAPRPAAPAKVITRGSMFWDETRGTGVFMNADDARKYPIFTDIVGQFAMLPDTAAIRKFKAGEVICYEGEGGTTAFYVAEGEVEVSIRGSSTRTSKRSGGLLAMVGNLLGQRKVQSNASHKADALVPIDASVDLKYGKRIATMKSGEVFGEMSCLSRAPRSATIIAKTDCTLIEFIRVLYERLSTSKSFKTQAEKNYRERAMGGHLRNVPVFDGLPDEAIARLCQTCDLVSFEPGQSIIKEGDAADAMYVIRLGQVRVSKKMPGGDLTVAYLTKGDCFGEIGMLKASPRTTSCEAYSHPPSVEGTAREDYKAKATKVELVKVKKAEFDWLVREYPSVKDKLERLAEERTVFTQEAGRHLESRKVPRRVEDLGLLQGQGLLLIDLEKCTRCDQCVQACVSSHDDGVTRLVREGPRYDKYLVPSRCRMCMDPVCMIGCPVSSIRRTKDLSMVIEDWCIGCEICAKQCPYNSIQMHKVKELENTEPEERPPLPAGAAAPPVREDRAVVCDQCATLPQGPSCVYACPHDAAFRVNAREFFQLTFEGAAAIRA
ncbi:MAG: cyclic nucleotide-binding domain-containing protein [Phycisphaerales bacterium]